jgi:hypothetical protein
LRCEILCDILAHPNLNLADEDSLVRVISELGSEFSDLLSYVDCALLTSTGMECFLDLVPVDRVNPHVWNSISEWIRKRTSGKQSSRPPTSGRYRELPSLGFPFTPGSEFQGILAHLTPEGGNVHQAGIVQITSSGDRHGSGWKIAGVGVSAWHTLNKADSWVQFDFKKNVVALSGYSLQSAEVDFHHPVSWIVEGSNNGTQWTEINSQATDVLRGRRREATFICAAEVCGMYWRFIRLRQVGRDSDGQYFLYLSRIEFYGNLREGLSQRGSLDLDKGRA